MEKKRHRLETALSDEEPEMKRGDERGEITTAEKPNHHREEKLFVETLHIIGNHKDPRAWSNQVKPLEEVKEVGKCKTEFYKNNPRTNGQIGLKTLSFLKMC